MTTTPEVRAAHLDAVIALTGGTAHNTFQWAAANQIDLPTAFDLTDAEFAELQHRAKTAHTTIPLVDQWQVQLDANTETMHNAARDNVTLAVRLLAAGFRKFYPEAARITLSESDQGSWLRVDAVIDANDEPYDNWDFPKSWDLASYLEWDHLDASPHLRSSDNYGPDGLKAGSDGTYYIDIAGALTD
ncbi:MAG: hypothetical protein ACOH1Y_11795 [Propionicimonas sp.]